MKLGSPKNSNPILTFHFRVSILKNRRSKNGFSDLDFFGFYLSSKSLLSLRVSHDLSDSCVSGLNSVAIFAPKLFGICSAELSSGKRIGSTAEDPEASQDLHTTQI